MRRTQTNLTKFHGRPLMGLALCLTLGVAMPSMAAESYRVRTGDTLSSIAQQYNTTVQKLLEINNLKSANEIKVGNLIRLSDAKATYYQGKTMSYTVQSGDSLTSIAKKFDTTIATLAELNDQVINDNLSMLPVGQKLTVPFVVIRSATPSAVTAAPAQPKVTPTAPPPASNTKASDTKAKDKTFIYVVKPNDTLRGVANKFKMNYTDLAVLNDLSTTAMLDKGQKLSIPRTSERLAILAKENDTPDTVTVKPSATTAVKPLTIKETTTVKTVDKPNVSVEFSSYQVKSGDSLSNLARRYNTSVEGLATMNRLSPTATLKTGQRLLVPVIKR